MLSFLPFFLFFFLHLDEEMGVSRAYGGDRVPICVNQIVMLCASNLYSDGCQLNSKKGN